MTDFPLYLLTQTGSRHSTDDGQKRVKMEKDEGRGGDGKRKGKGENTREGRWEKVGAVGKEKVQGERWEKVEAVGREKVRGRAWYRSSGKGESTREGMV